MQPYHKVKTENDEQFKRNTGISKENFQHLLNKVSDYIDQEKIEQPIKNRGLNISKLPLEDRVLLTLYYLRHYTTLLNLGHVFNISESYCQKIYSRYARILAKVENLPNRKNLLENKKDILIIDVSEQAIERPVKHQKAYYSGKKKDTPLKRNLSSAP